MRAWLAWGFLLTSTQCLSAEAQEEPVLRIAAASDMRVVLPRLLNAFEDGRVRGLKVTYGSSGKLHTQIVQGAPYDVFFSADGALVDDLVGRGLARADTRAALGEGRLVLWCRPEASVKPSAGLAGLLTVPGLRLAIAHPDHAPFGRAAREALRRAGAWQRLEKRIVRAENVAQAAQLAASGAASAALIARPLLQEPALAQGRTWQVPPAWHPTLRQEAVSLTRSAMPLAGELVRFVACARGQAICQAAGLAPLTEPPRRGKMPGGIR
jgi:molybdate transport system substrate-binding protein